MLFLPIPSNHGVWSRFNFQLRLAHIPVNQKAMAVHLDVYLAYRKVVGSILNVREDDLPGLENDFHLFCRPRQLQRLDTD